MNVIKKSISDLYRLYPQCSALIPASPRDFEAFKKIPKDKQQSIKVVRSYPTHKFLWKMIECAMFNGINDMDCKIEDTDFVITNQIIKARFLESGCDWSETWRGILQELFLEKEQITTLTGDKEYIRGSISYMKRDEIEYKKFLDKVASFFSYNLGISIEDFKRNAGAK